MSNRQLLLDLPPREGMGREDFLPAPSNQPGLQALEAWRHWPGALMLIIGPAGSGRTHLAQIWTSETGGVVLPATALDADTLPRTDALPSLAIDDAETVAGTPEAEEALFHLINRARNGGTALMITARDHPGTWGIALPDLASRLQAAPTTALQAPGEDLIAMVLVKLCDDRQLAVTEPALHYLATRLDRSLALARDVVDAMDRIAVTENRPVTRQLATEVLQALAPRDEAP
ncbi:MAG: DnaA/Hda family protein [Pseudomonadota bacterium]